MDCLTNAWSGYRLRSEGYFPRLVLGLNWNVNFTSRKDSEHTKSMAVGPWMEELGLWGHLPGCKKG